MSNYEAIWRASLPYMRSRKNDVHIPLSFACAEGLLTSHPEANQDVVLLAILLHDLGWSAVDQDEIYSKGFGPGMWESDVRKAHEKEGARIAREILEPLAYPSTLVEEVVLIIDGHDTRKEVLSLNDGLVKDADKLWRFTVTGVSIACDWFKMTPAAYAQRLELEVLPQLYSAAARDMAHQDLALTKQRLKLDFLA